MKKHQSHLIILDKNSKIQFNKSNSEIINNFKTNFYPYNNFSSNNNKLKKDSIDVENKIIAKRIKAINNWKKAKNILNAIFGFYNTKVNKIHDNKSLTNEFNTESYKFRSKNNKKRSTNKIKILNENQLNRNHFTQLCSIGGKKEIEKIIKILKNDISNHCYEKDDKNNILNKKNINNETPSFIACKNGNLEVLKILIDNKSNWKLKVNNISILEISVIWNHIMIIDYLLENKLYELTDIKKSLKLTKNKEIYKKLKNKIPKKKCFC